jgi:uncharacterized membrane protein YphA (DoxX/SURF4 family)
MKTVLTNSWLELAARWILGITFIYAAYHKIIAPADFAKIIYGYELFPHDAINLIAIVLPFIELTSGLALILGIYPRSAVLIINGMLLAFILVLSINLIRGHEFECGCFSVKKAGYLSSAEPMLIRDIIYLILGSQVFLFSGIRKGCIGFSWINRLLMRS